MGDWVMSVCMFVCLYVCLSVCLSVCVSVRPSIRPSLDVCRQTCQIATAPTVRGRLDSVDHAGDLHSIIDSSVSRIYRLETFMPMTT